MADFTTTKATLDDIANRSEANRKRIEQAKTLIDTAEADLIAMSSVYGSFVTQLNIDAAANAGDIAWDHALAEKNQLASDFTALKGRATAIKTAITGL